MENNTFKDTLAKLMNERKINQLTLAAELSVRQSQVSNWLNGKSLPGYQSIKRISEFFQVSADVIVGNKPN